LLAISYLNKLNKIGRFKEVYYAAEELIHLMSPSHSLDKKAELLLIFGQSARMMGKREEAIDIIRGITDDPEINLTKEKRASANLDLALAYHSKGDSKDAIEAAMIVTKLEKKGTAYYDQARSIIIEENLQREEAMKELKQIEKKSWRLSRDTNASNIALTLARLSSALDEKIKYYDSVIDSSCSDYNRVRAIVNKTDELLKASRHNELRYKDKALLQASFSYCYSQNIENLFNKCTRVIWELLSKANRYDQVLKLFRYSSLVWRLRGEQETEKKYLEIISSFSEDFLASAQETDVCYYKMRLSS